MIFYRWLLLFLVCAFAGSVPALAGAPKKKVLLLWHSPDGHPAATHEYQLGQKILKGLLDKQAGIDATLVCADEPWKDGPRLLADTDGVVLFVSEGAKWLQADPDRLAAFRKLAGRKGGLSVLHWGMGTKDAKNIPAFVDLFGGCHGGPERKYQVVSGDISVASCNHPIIRGMKTFNGRDEFYYHLKLPNKKNAVHPLLQVEIDKEMHTVAWAYPRPDGGRSFGFSGLHFHSNWEQPEYRRFITQGVMWTLDVDIPLDGIPRK